MDDLVKLIAAVEPLAARVALNARHIAMGFRPDDDPAERARQVFYRAHERYAIARDIVALAALTGWASVLPEFQAEADRLQEEARKAGEAAAEQADARPKPVALAPAPEVVDVQLPA